MAWRIHDNVTRGVIDNRERGRVRGKIWIHGRTEPIRLFLEGNGYRDLAGCLLTFESNQETVPLSHDGFSSIQEGTAGDLTASRKVREFEVPIEQALTMKRQGLPVPEHMANSLYLEWFSNTNGRVVIEGTHYSMDISPPAWTLSDADEIARRKQAEDAFTNFVKDLSEAVNAARSEAASEEWDNGEVEHDQSELLNDIPLVAPDPLTEGKDWVRDKDGEIRHPLCARAFHCAMDLWHRCEELGLNAAQDPDLCELNGEYHMTGVKLAGALNKLAYGQAASDSAFVVVHLRRALIHLDHARAALERLAPGTLLPVELITSARADLAGIRKGVLSLMKEFDRE